MNDSTNIKRIGMDIGKNSFHLFGVNQHDRAVLKKKLKRDQVLAFYANLPPCEVAMEACGGSNYWVRELKALGHEVKLISPQYVKPYVKGNKNDYNDAEAICEAAGRPGMRFVAPKSIEQQDLQALHRCRQLAIKQRTMLANQLRGLLAEYGLVISKSITRLRQQLPAILEDAENGLSSAIRELLTDQWTWFKQLDEQAADWEKRIQRQHRQHEASQRLASIPGVGPLSATAVIASFGEGGQYQDGRQYAASLGLVPRQHSTGGRNTLLGISKRGDTYLRTLLIHGARAVIQHLGDKQDARSCWLRRLVERAGVNKAAVALANKNARTIWAMLTRGESYQVAA